MTGSFGPPHWEAGALSNMPAKHSYTTCCAKKRRQSLASQHITAARADGKPQPMAGCLETH